MLLKIIWLPLNMMTCHLGACILLPVTNTQYYIPVQRILILIYYNIFIRTLKQMAHIGFDSKQIKTNKKHSILLHAHLLFVLLDRCLA